ncbi:MAG: hypothetical protein Q4F84_04000 [Fibrobacter sp.]|nr:hypothetical protein [Fibrobacter sp.]
MADKIRKVGEIELGNWVTCIDARGIFEVVGFYKDYQLNDFLSRRRGEFIGIQAILIKLFTGTMKTRLKEDSFSCHTDCLKRVDSQKEKEINQFWEEHPKEYKEYLKKHLGFLNIYEKFSDRWTKCDLLPQQIEDLEKAMNRLPLKFNWQQFVGWRTHSEESLNEIAEQRGLKGTKKRYYITVDLLEEGVPGKLPLYINPRIILED